MSSSNKINLHIKEKTCLTLSLVAIASLMFAPISFTASFAEEDTNVIWQLLFVKEGTCGPDDNLDQVYASLTSKYFELYQIVNSGYEPTCISESEYKNFQFPEDVNLSIIIYDEVLGNNLLGPHNLDGVYIHSGNDRLQNHLIIMCHCSDYDSSYENTLPSWILSHELSHFVLSFKGYSQSAIQEKIHSIENEYDSCVGMNFGNENCKEFRITLNPESSTKDYVMMTPYEPAIGNKLIKYIPDDYSNSEVIDLQRDLAKMWVTNTIDDVAFKNTLKHLVDSSSGESSEVHEPFIEIPNGFVIAEVSKPSKIEWDEYLDPLSDEQKDIQKILDYVPFNLEENSEELNLEKMPNWFKTRALLWSEKRISDKVFFDGVEHLVRMGIVSIS